MHSFFFTSQKLFISRHKIYQTFFIVPSESSEIFEWRFKINKISNSFFYPQKIYKHISQSALNLFKLIIKFSVKFSELIEINWRFGKSLINHHFSSFIFLLPILLNTFIASKFLFGKTFRFAVYAVLLFVVWSFSRNSNNQKITLTKNTLVFNKT